MFRESECTGNKALCEYLMDSYDTLMESSLKHTPWLMVCDNFHVDIIIGYCYSFYFFKIKRIKNVFPQKPAKFMKISEQAKILAKNVIIIHLKYRSSEVDMTILESRYSFSEKIANFGGMFGIWAEFTGFSLLGIINVCLIVLKLLVGRLNHWKTDCLSNSN